MISPFYSHLSKGYIYSKDAIPIEDILNHQNIDLPIDVDTEFDTPEGEIKENNPRKLIAAQIKGIKEKISDAKIFVPTWLVDEANYRGLKVSYPVIQNEQSFIFDWIKTNGVEFKLRHESRLLSAKYRKSIKDKKLKTLTIKVYSHFALAEYFNLGTNEFRDCLYRASVNTNPSGNKVEMIKRLRVCTTHKGMSRRDSINMPFYLDMYGETFLLKMGIIDSCALQGVASYRKLLEVFGISTIDKELFSQYEKENMLETFFSRPKDFDAYARGDLMVYDILEKNSEKYRQIYDMVDITDYYTEPKLSIGSTVEKMLVSSIKKYLGINHDDKESIKSFEALIKPASTNWLKTQINTTVCLQGKVFGGRCRNNRPTISMVFGVLIDIDIASCYGNGLRNQNYFVGIPVIEDFDNSDNNNDYPSLEKWLKQRKYNTDNCEIRYGAWQAMVFSESLLTIPQDFLISWTNYKLEEINQESELEVKSGNTKIFKYEIKDAVITDDFLEWLFNVCSPKQRNELLVKLKIKSAIYYPNSGKVKSIKELLRLTKEWCELNTTKAVKKDNDAYTIVKTTNRPTYHIELNLGELLIDDMLLLRTFYKKVYGKGSTFEQLFKLNTNTTFGDLCSIFFKTSNTVVANNITARARALCWYMEKGLNGFMSITDGCPFLINKVPYPYGLKQLYADNFVDLYSDKNPINKRHIQLKPIGNMSDIAIDFDTDTLKLTDLKGGETIMNKEKGLEWIATQSFKHLQSLFPVVSVLHSQSTIIELDKKDKKIKCECKEGNNYLSEAEILIVKDYVKVDYLDMKNKINEDDNDKYNCLFTKGDNYLYVEQIKLFPNGTVKPFGITKNICGMFEFEVKEWYEGGSFQGTSNYYLHNPNHPYKPEDELVIRMRSYEKGKHCAIELDENNELIETDYFKNNPPSQEFLKYQLYNNPSLIKRSKVFSKKGILKINEHRQNAEKYSDIGIVPGDNVKRFGLLRELSLSQFTFNTQAQFKAINREYEANKRKYNQSYEMFFVDKQGFLNYKLMVEKIDSIIRSGAMSINKALDPNMNRARDLPSLYHPENEVYKALRSDNKFLEIEENDNGEFDLVNIFSLAMEGSDSTDFESENEESIDYGDLDL